MVRLSVIEIIMPLSWNEIRARAGRFATEWQGRGYEKGDTGQFYHQFFEVFGRRARDVNLYFEKRVKLPSNTQGFIDLFWPGTLLVEQKSLGLSLEKARVQATDYYLTLKDDERPRYILLSDFQNFELLDLETNETHIFTLAALPDNIRRFDFVAGYQREQYKDQPEVNIEAATLMGNLHAQLEKSGYSGVDLEKLLVRLMFCLFADDTGIFNPDSFLNYIEIKTSGDGRDLGSNLIHLFETLDTAPADRQKTLDEDLAEFPHVNGKLFAGLIRTPSFDAPMRQALLQCCRFKWNRVSPALFGSLFQMVMLPEEQRRGGAHYTSERNILKTIHPLFLDELREEFEKIRHDKSTQRESRLKKFHEKLGTLTFFDPACGCGNFLILAYRELRLLELEVLEALHPKRQLELDVKKLSKVDVDQFYGIEIEEFPAHIAEAAMWLVDHQMNMKLSESFGQSLVRLPLKKSAHITQGNALTIPWKDIIAPSKLSYMLGNPPFVGSKYQNDTQRAELVAVFDGIIGAGVLDYVTAWYWKAAQYIQGTRIKVAFVSTNSITQGEQAGILWQPLLSRYGIRIQFAHRTFKWTIDEKKAKGMRLAAVYCVIVGFTAYEPDEKWLFDYEKPTSEPHRAKANNINPYLVDATNAVIVKRSKPLCNVPEINFGNQPIDGGGLILSGQERNDILSYYPDASPLIRKFVGAEELINGSMRYCLWLKNVSPALYRNIKPIIERLEYVRKNRLGSARPATKELASTPSLFGFISHEETDYIIIPSVSSERRLYVPIDIFSRDVIASNLCLIIPNATLYHFGVLTSLMHMDWMRHVCGRLESRYRYSNTLVYNNFPWPAAPSAEQVKVIEDRAQAVLEARAQFPNSTLADLYDPLTMPPALLKAHQALDKAVDAAYRKKPFESERERIEYLFAEYQRLTAPLIGAIKPKPRKKRGTT
jgi:type I restriction-modification system DNA methylase subunit